jgi:CHASE2 domain-containing sensor protein
LLQQLFKKTVYRRTIQIGLVLSIFILLGLCSRSADGIARLDGLFQDRILQVRQAHGAPPVYNQIVFLDIESEELDSTSDARTEYHNLSKYTEQCRNQGAQTVALDLLLTRGKPADFRELWEQWSEGYVVTGRTWTDLTKLRPLQGSDKEAVDPPVGLLYAPDDRDGIHRRYLLAQRSPDGSTALPSLALATYLTRQGLKWDPAWLKGEFLEFQDADLDGNPVERKLPNEIWLDYRCRWSDSSPSSFGHVNPKRLQEFEDQALNSQLEGRVVLLSYTASGAGDLGPTPLESSVPKVSIHGTALNDLFQNSWRTQLSGFPILAGALAISAVAVLVGGLSGWLAGLLWLLGTVAIFAAGVWAMLLQHCLIPCASLSLLWTVLVALEQWAQSKLRLLRESEATASADMADPMISKNLGQYRVVEKIGQGGFATVYRAVPFETLDPEQSVAIKIVNEASIVDSEMRRRFLREIRISAGLSHPNIVQVLDSGDQNGLLYLVMERLKGKSLRQLLDELQSQAKSEPVSWSRALQIVRPLLKAMVYAHTKNVLHRDLKPENVMLELDPQQNVINLKVLDFGLAFDDASSRITRASEVAGTFDYLAPERIQGVSDDLRSDLYAIGLIIYELLANSLPFPKQSMAQSLMLRLSQDCPPLKERRGDLPDSVCCLVDKMIAREPDARFSNCQEVLQQLDSIA